MTFSPYLLANAIAVQYRQPEIVPPAYPFAGITPIRRCTSDLPNRLTGALPQLLVFVDSGEFVVGNGTRIGVHRLPVRFYYAKTADLERETVAVNAWLDPLLGRLGVVGMSGMSFEQAEVTAVRVVSYRVGIMPYAGEDFTGAELMHEVVTSEPWTPVP